MKRGTPNIRRVHAKNYHYKESQARLDEIVPAFNKQVLNSLEVDYVPVQYYTIIHSGQRCTCDRIEIPTVVSGIPVVAAQGGSPGTFAEETYEVIGKDSLGSLFGDSPANKEQDAGDPYSFDETEAVPITNMNQIFSGGNTNCGICYRSGYYCSYDLHLGTRLVLGTLNYSDVEGYNIDYSAAPNVFKRLHDDGYVLFSFVVPKYVKEIRFSIRNNLELLHEAILYTADMLPMTRSYLDQNQGRRVEVVVMEPVFTHAVLEFSLNIDPVQVNLAGINRTLDYTMLETVGNLSVIAPMTISVVSSGDVIAAPSRNLFLKVVDVEYAQTATMRKLEWRLQCRVLQPTEALKKLSSTRKI